MNHSVTRALPTFHKQWGRSLVADTGSSDGDFERSVRRGKGRSVAKGPSKAEGQEREIPASDASRAGMRGMRTRWSLGMAGVVHKAGSQRKRT